MQLISLFLKNQIHDIDLRSLLCLGGLLLQDAADGEGMAEHVGGGLGYLIPFAIRLTRLVGIGKEDHLVASQRLEFRYVQLRLAARS